MHGNNQRARAQFRVISSRRPQLIALLCAFASVLSLMFGANELVKMQRIDWLLVALSLVHGIVAVVCLLAWKTVRVGEDGYFVSDVFRSEIVAFSDVCLTVDATGALWKCVRIHFKRPTRFGWSVSFVPTRSVAHNAAAQCQSLVSASRSSKRVVAIDDDSTFLELIATVLEKRGFEVERAMSGSDGIRAATCSLPHVVISDVMMPGVGGQEVVRTLKSQHSTAHIPILLMSGCCESDAKRAGDAFLAKPFNIDDLTSTVERLAIGHQNRHQSALKERVRGLQEQA